MSVVTLSRHSSDAANAISNNTADEATNIPSAQADANNSTVSLVIGGDNQAVETEAGIGTVAYRKHTVTVELNNVSQYFLKFYGAEKLVPVDGGVNVEGVGATPVAGKEIQQGTWGYGWDATGMVADEDMQYQTVPTTSSDLAGPEIIDNSLTFTGKLNFAANFPSSATLGNYTSTATLTLIATPKANTGIINYWRTPEGGITAVDAGTDEMQGVGPDFCSDEVGEGWTVELRDNRGDSPVTYTIVKLKDGNCWMGQNLALAGPMTLTSGDTDLPEGETWELPASTTSWNTNSDDVAYNAVQIKIGNSSISGWKDGYGNYYSWAAATAGSGTTDVVDVDATSSICPAGWKLPTYSGDYSFQNLISTKSDWATGVAFNGVSDNNGYYFGSVNTAIYKGANFWPAAGIVGNGVGGVNELGAYWSRRAFSNDFQAYGLFFRNDTVSFQYNGGRQFGHSVRCVHNSEQVGIWKNNANENGSFDSGLRYMQDVTMGNFVNKYCTGAAADVMTGATVRLIDNRDKKTYNVVKLSDGNCWMQENLALDGGAKLTPENSDVLREWDLPQSTDTNIDWSSEYTSARMKNGSISLEGWIPKYGNYYNWCAATALSCNKNYDGDAITSEQANESICPRGWKLPVGGTGGNFRKLFGDAGSNLGSDVAMRIRTVQQHPYLFPAAGEMWYGYIGGAGTHGYYWTRTPLSSYQAVQTFYFYSNFFAPANGSVVSGDTMRSKGASVRCVAEPEK